MFDWVAYEVADVSAVDWDGPHEMIIEVTLKSATGVIVGGFGFCPVPHR